MPAVRASLRTQVLVPNAHIKAGYGRVHLNRQCWGAGGAGAGGGGGETDGSHRLNSLRA